MYTDAHLSFEWPIPLHFVDLLAWLAVWMLKNSCFKCCFMGFKATIVFSNMSGELWAVSLGNYEKLYKISPFWCFWRSFQLLNSCAKNDHRHVGDASPLLCSLRLLGVDISRDIFVKHLTVCNVQIKKCQWINTGTFLTVSSCSWRLESAVSVYLSKYRCSSVCVSHSPTVLTYVHYDCIVTD